LQSGIQSRKFTNGKFEKIGKGIGKSTNRVDEDKKSK
jgi:hypothetical protein